MPSKKSQHASQQLPSGPEEPVSLEAYLTLHSEDFEADFPKYDPNEWRE